METIRFKNTSHCELEREVMPKGFAILGYYCRISDYVDVFYELFFGDGVICNLQITEQQAKKLISKYNLKLVVYSAEGKVWE